MNICMNEQNNSGRTCGKMDAELVAMVRGSHITLLSCLVMGVISKFDVGMN